MKMLVVLFIAVLLTACGSGGGGSAGAGAGTGSSGVNMSGTWNAISFQCRDSALAGATYNSTLHGNGYARQIVISGSSFSDTVSVTGCSLTRTGTISFGQTMVTVSTITLTNVTSGSCSLAYTTPAGISPGLVSDVWSNGQTHAGFTNRLYFQANPGEFAMPVSLTYPAGPAGGLCFEIMDKQ